MVIIYPLFMSKIAIENGPVEIVDLPGYKMVMFHSYGNVYQRVYILYIHMIQPSLSPPPKG